MSVGNTDLIFQVQLDYNTSPAFPAGVVGAPGVLMLATHNQMLPLQPSGTVAFAEDRLSQPMRFEKNLFARSASYGDTGVSTGTIEAYNSDGGLDPLVTYSFEVIHDITTGYGVKLFAYRYPFDGTAGVQLTVDVPFAETGEATESTFVFNLRDYNWAFRNPILKAKFAGTGGLNGGPELKDQYRPRVVGKVFNITPILVDADNLIYQIDGQTGLQTGWSLVVKDKGVSMLATIDQDFVATVDPITGFITLTLVATSGTEYVDEADMYARPPRPGQWRVWPAGGYLRLGVAPQKLTVDVVNPQVRPTTPVCTVLPSAGFGGVSLQAVALRLAIDAGGPLAATYRFDATQLFAHNLLPQVGLYITDGAMTTLDALNEIMRSQNCGFISTYQGMTLVQCRQMDGGDLSYSPTVTWNIPTYAVKDARIVTSGNAQKDRPVWKVTHNYGRNYTVMTDDEIAGSVSDTLKAALKREWQTSIFDNSTILSQWPQASEITFQSAQSINETELEAARIGKVFSYPRRVYEIDISVEWLTQLLAVEDVETVSAEVGQVVRLTYPRLGLDNGKLLQVVGKLVDLSAGIVTLTLWG